MFRLSIQRKFSLALLCLFFTTATAGALHAQGGYSGGFSGGSTSSGSSSGGFTGGNLVMPPAGSTTTRPPSRPTTGITFGGINIGNNGSPQGLPPRYTPPTNWGTRTPPRPERPVVSVTHQNRLHQIQQQIQSLHRQRYQLEDKLRRPCCSKCRQNFLGQMQNVKRQIWQLEQEFFRIKNGYIKNPANQFATEDSYFRPFDATPNGSNLAGKSP